MTDKGEDKRDLMTLAELEAGLRRLPKPPVPEGLEAALMAGIPAARPHPTAGSRIRSHLLAALAGSAIAVLILIVAYALLSGAPGTGGTTAPGVLRNTSPLFVGVGIHAHVRETQPCEILPPLPD